MSDFMNDEIFGDDNYDFGQNMDVEDIEVEDPTLFSVTVDRSGTMRIYEGVMPGCMRTIQQSVIDSKSEDEFVVAINYFDDDVVLGGYQNIHNMPTAYKAGGCTALYDAIVKAGKALSNEDGTGYYDIVRASGGTPKGIFAVVSDGKDNVSKCKPADAKEVINYLNKKEIITVYIAFGKEAIGIGEDLGFENVMNEKDANEKELRKIFRLLSKSAISASKSKKAVPDGGFFQV